MFVQGVSPATSDAPTAVRTAEMVALKHGTLKRKVWVVAVFGSGQPTLALLLDGAFAFI